MEHDLRENDEEERWQRRQQRRGRGGWLPLAFAQPGTATQRAVRQVLRAMSYEL